MVSTYNGSRHGYVYKLVRFQSVHFCAPELIACSNGFRIPFMIQVVFYQFNILPLILPNDGIVGPSSLIRSSAMCISYNNIIALYLPFIAFSSNSLTNDPSGVLTYEKDSTISRATMTPGRVRDGGGALVTCHVGVIGLLIYYWWNFKYLIPHPSSH
ncbi:hypothetical protein BYT27DRAFT_6758042 [Phlegmacium glaucopus]|nr:hypothetical protein BYT27DRAFT_6758042 [Phlegmacium glaucopus]